MKIWRPVFPYRSSSVITRFFELHDIPGLSRYWNNGLVRAVFDNWQVSGTTSYASGKPKTFGTGTGLNWTYGGTASATNITDFSGGDINARPVIICDPNRRPGTSDPLGTPYLIDTSCFAKPGTAGSSDDLLRIDRTRHRTL